MIKPEMERRRAATHKTLARYRGKSFDWATGATCVHLARTHLRNMGRRPRAVPPFNTALGAKKALQANGWESVVDMLDAHLERIAPAAALLGDLVATEGEDGFNAVFVYCGGRAMFGWAEGHDKPVPAVDVRLDKLAGAWRV